MKYYLGLDNGGTTTKASVISETGMEIATAGATTKSIKEKPGFVERDMEEMWQTNCSVIRRALEKAGLSGEDISGIGICGHGKGLYLWGKDNRPARAGILSADTRALEYAERWKKDGTDERASKRNGQHIMACQPAALLAWLKEYEPETLRNIQWVFACKDYIRFRMTGEARAELTDYSGDGLVNLYTRSYDDELLRIFDMTEIRDALPPLCLSADIAGYVTKDAAAACGLKAGTPVVGGMFDIDACALAVNVLDEKNLCVIAGTWSINEYLSKTMLSDDKTRMHSVFCIPEYYLIEESSATSAGNNEWFLQQMFPNRENLSNQELYKIVNGWVESVSENEFVPVFLPFLMASNVHPYAKGAFVGMNVSHTRRHLARSVYEGITFCHRQHIDRLLETRKTPPEKIRLAGGAAKSKVWTQMFADVMQLPVESSLTGETGALGCAIAAAVGTGRYENFRQAARSMCRMRETVYPDSGRKEIYEKKYRLYQKTAESLDSLWDDMQRLAENGTC